MTQRHPLVYIFSVGLVMLLATIAMMYEMGLLVIRDHDVMARDLRVHADLAALASTIKDIETGQRGYVITGEDPYLEPYRLGLKQLEERLNAVSADIASGIISQEQFDEIKTLVRQKMDELEETIRLRREKGLDAALKVVHTNRGKQLMDEIRTQISQLQTSAQITFADASAHASHLERIRTYTFIAGGLINIVGLIWAVQTIRAEMTRRERATLETMRQHEFLSTTLASIGDAVILTDGAGAITFLNREAERLTGWPTAEAAKRSLPEVFHIINEHSRERVENPVEKVLRLGKVVGLANHTILIARDGGETPIDDSAAPIRDHHGNVFGTVLVFRDFTEQKKVQAALSNSKVELEKVVEERTIKLREMVAELQQVSYAISHDMRAPLRAMSGFATLLQEESRQWNNPATTDYSNRIVQAAARLDRLIQDSLHYTKAVLQEIPMGPVDLDELVRGLIDSYPNIQPDKADISIEGRLPCVLGNESLLTQCFSNVLGNAVKFVAPGVRPRVRVWAETSGKMTTIRLEDNGIGIPAIAQARLFKMFERVNDNYEGTGIGLAIVKKVAERMGGRVGVISEPAKGSQFWVELPLAQPPG